MMQVTTIRQVGESILLGSDDLGGVVLVRIVAVRGSRVQLEVTAPQPIWVSGRSSDNPKEKDHASQQ